MKPSIWKSRKFWIAVVDTVVSIIGIWVGVLFAPDYAELIVLTVAALQIPVGVLINSIAKEDVAAMETGYAPKTPQQ